MKRAVDSFDIKLARLSEAELDQLAHVRVIDAPDEELAALLNSTDCATASGMYEGRHYTAYVADVKALKRAGELAEAEHLLLLLLDVIEAQARTEDVGVAPWYYEQLAIIYAKQKRGEDEIAILERFAQQHHDLCWRRRSTTP